MADTLSALNIPKATAFLSGANAPVTPKGYVGMRELAPIQEELAAAESQAQEDVGMADINIEKAKKEETTRDLESQAKFAKEEADKLRDLPERQAMKEKRKEFGDFKFVPTKENAQDLATLFSLVSVIGMAIGGGGKENAQASMSAMNGMLEGHQKGRADLYKQQQVEFDKNFKAMQAAVQSAEKEYEEAVKMHLVDKEAGEMARKMALAKMHSPMLKAMEDRLGPLAVLNTLKELKTSVKNATELENKLQAQADKRQDAKDAKEAAERRHKEDAAQRERLAKMRGGGGGAVSGMSPKELFEDAAKAIANYAEKPPALRDPQRNALLARARQINPNYNEAGYGDRDIAYRNWINPNGAGFKQIAAFTTVAGHLDTLDKLGVALKNNDTQAINSAYNWFKTATGDASVTNFNAAKQAVAAETIKAINGTAGALRDREEAAAIFGAVQSPAQLKGAISTVKELINSRLQTSQAMFEAGTGRRNFEELLPPIVKRTFQTGGAPQAAAAPALTGAAAIPTGKSVSVDEERSRAKAAIAAGKDSDAVKARFKEKTGQEL